GPFRGPSYDGAGASRRPRDHRTRPCATPMNSPRIAPNDRITFAFRIGTSKSSSTPMAAPYPRPAPTTVDRIHHPPAPTSDRRRTNDCAPPTPRPTAAPDVIWMAAPPTATLMV